MATKPGILTNWPWKSIGNFKYVILAPWVVHSTYSFLMSKEGKEADLFYFLIFPLFIMARFLHNQIWISISRHRTAKGNNRIVDKGIDFEQVDRESNWDDQIILVGIFFYLSNMIIPGASNLPLWRLDGVIITILLHTGPVEFLYYWFHRALHHHYLYSRYHSHHHSSIVTEPITSVIHPFAEEFAYILLFAIPLMTLAFTGTASLVAMFGYITYIDFMNNMGHCNFELVPNWLFSTFPFLKYIMYTPSYHSLHHTQFRTNYSLFMPMYDYLYDTVDKSSDDLHVTSLKRQEDCPDIVHLTHLTTTDSIYHLRLAFASLASKPYASNRFFNMVMWPVTCWSVALTWFYGCTFVSERNDFNNLKLQSWVIPRFTMHYQLRKELGDDLDNLIEEAISEADNRGAKVVSLGLLNQDEELNGNGEVYIQRCRNLKIKVVDGSSLAAAVVVNSIPKQTTEVILRGKLSKVAYAIALALCQQGVQVATMKEDEYKKLRQSLDMFASNLVLATNYDQKIWLVGEGLTKEEQLKASKGSLFIPFSQFPPKKVRREDCFYHTTPALLAPKSLHNLHSCENWLARRVMSAWRVAGIVHGVEGWNVNECGESMFNMDKVWEAALRLGFRPLSTTY